MSLTPSAYESPPPGMSPPRATATSTSGRKLESATRVASSRIATPNCSHVSTSVSTSVEASAW
ncbi:hypothetical protein [Terrabacter sp. Root85]|uniref:hypothetical protein n=1 Tax=Terrabacter sp. Root85 TaxID=1736603 RepID=UPI00350ED26B